MNEDTYSRYGVDYGRITRALEACPSPDLLEWKIDLIKSFSRKISKENVGMTIEDILDKAIRKMNRVGDDAGEIGTDVDEYLKARILGNKLPKLKSDESKNCLACFDKWLADYPAINLKVSETVYDDEILIAGTPDFEDEDTVYDLKSSNAIRRKYWLQTEFYGRKLGKKFKAIVRVHKEIDSYEFMKVPLSDDDWECVKSAVNLFRFYNKENI